MAVQERGEGVHLPRAELAPAPQPPPIVAAHVLSAACALRPADDWNTSAVKPSQPAKEPAMA